MCLGSIVSVQLHPRCCWSVGAYNGYGAATGTQELSLHDDHLAHTDNTLDTSPTRRVERIWG